LLSMMSLSSSPSPFKLDVVVLLEREHPLSPNFFLASSENRTI